MEDHRAENNEHGTWISDNVHPVAGKGSAPSLVFIIDDEESICQCFAEILRSIGYPVATCTNPIEAIEYYKKHFTSIALVILDMIMPEMNGDDVFMAMRTINPALKAVMISGQCSETVVAECLAAGAVEFARKPMTVKEIIDLVDKHVLSGQPESRQHGR